MKTLNINEMRDQIVDVLKRLLGKAKLEDLETLKTDIREEFNTEFDKQKLQINVCKLYET